MARRFAAIAPAILGILLVAAPVSAQQYPSRTVTIIVPFPAGGPTDETARVVAHSLSATLKQTFIVENVSGGNIGSQKVARAAADGYTLLLHNTQISINATLYKNIPFDTAKAFAPVMLINRNPMVLVGRKSLKPNTLTELIALMKNELLTAAISGYGVSGHLLTTLLAQEAKVKVNQIPYRGGAPAMTDLLGGHVDLFFATPQQVVQQVATGGLKAYGVTSKEEVPEVPGVESFVKVFGPKFDVVYWQALFAPAGTPDAVIKTLNDALQATVSDPAIVKTWAGQGVSVFPKDQRSPAAANALLQSEMTRWGQVIRDNDIYIDK